MNRYLQLLCSTCSNPNSPEFRSFVWDTDKNTLTCEICGRKLAIKHEPSDDGSHLSRWFNNNIKGKPEFRNDYILEVIDVGTC